MVRVSDDMVCNRRPLGARFMGEMWLVGLFLYVSPKSNQIPSHSLLKLHIKHFVYPDPHQIITIIIIAVLPSRSIMHRSSSFFSIQHFFQVNPHLSCIPYLHKSLLFEHASCIDSFHFLPIFIYCSLQFSTPNNYHFHHHSLTIMYQFFLLLHPTFLPSKVSPYLSCISTTEFSCGDVPILNIFSALIHFIFLSVSHLLSFTVSYI